MQTAHAFTATQFPNLTLFDKSIFRGAQKYILSMTKVYIVNNSSHIPNRRVLSPLKTSIKKFANNSEKVRELFLGFLSIDRLARQLYIK